MMKIAVLGYGTVGSGVIEVLKTNAKLINQNAQEEISVKYVLDLRDFEGDPIQKIIVHDFDVILNDPEVKIVVEVMGGIEPAYTFVKNSLLAGKSVTTSNKALVAEHGTELLSIAREQGVNFLFEASVGGGIPIIRPLHTCITADQVEEVFGILNGTTNYMMTKMFYEGANYDEVLKQAQDMGYAERNPEADVEGHDACRKIAILTSIVSGKTVRYEDIYTEGITKVSVEDMQYAKAMNMTIKLLASSKQVEGEFSAMVAPYMVGVDHPLYSVNDVLNAVYVKGNVLGPAMFYGSGAGKLPTASAVVSDIVDMTKHQGQDIMATWNAERLILKSKDEIEGRFFVRVAGNKVDMEEKVNQVFGGVQIIETEGVVEEFGFATDKMTERDYVKKSEMLPEIKSMIRIV